MSGTRAALKSPGDGTAATESRWWPRLKSALALLVALIVCFGAAGFGAQFMPGDWYAALRKPSWNPPGWVFGPVWTVLYFSMALSAWLIWRRGGFFRNALPLGLFLFQLVANALWSWFFFGRHRPDLAFADITVLWLGIAACILVFRRRSATAAWLLVPYLAWVSFAAVLNFVLWRMNLSAL